MGERLQAGAGYSRGGQDQWVLDQLGDATGDRPLFFLEIGARDGDFFSNTRRLEEHGWTGICVEPFPTNFKKYNRTCQLLEKALVAKVDPKRTYSNCEDGSGRTGLSGFTEDNKNGASKIGSCTQMPVPQMTFAEMTAPKVLDYVSLDVEGLELEILKAFPFAEHCARLWTIEGAGYEDPRSKDFLDILQSHGCTRQSGFREDGFFVCPCS